MGIYVVYVLYSQDHDRLYIGYTTELVVRFHYHNGLSKKGFTTRYRPWVVIHVEFYDEQNIAMKREDALKGGKGRAWIRETILPVMRNAGFISA